MMEKKDDLVAPRDVKVTPELRDNFDIEQLGRALIAAAINIAEQKKAAEAAQISANTEGDNVP